MRKLKKQLKKLVCNWMGAAIQLARKCHERARKGTGKGVSLLARKWHERARKGKCLKPDAGGAGGPISLFCARYVFKKMLRIRFLLRFVFRARYVLKKMIRIRVLLRFVFRARYVSKKNDTYEFQDSKNRP